MGVELELVDGERLVHAWKRFRARFPEEQLASEHADMLRQYVDTARFYHDKALRAQGIEEDDELARELVTIVGDATKLAELRCQSAAPLECCVPRPSEFLRRRVKVHIVEDSVAESSVGSPHHGSNEPQNDDTLPRRMDLSYDELKAMMEPKKLALEDQSTQEIRRRLGLLDRDATDQQSISSETIAREEQENIQADMVNLAKTLKARTQTINESLVDDAKILDAVGQSAESNAELLERENAVLKQQLASSIGFWTSLWLVMAAVMVFMATYIYMKLFSRRL